LTFSACLFICIPHYLAAKEPTDIIRKAAQRSTLNQPGTHPFHLQALFAPSKPDGSSAGRNGKIEIWWASPTQWRREVSCPGFRQIKIVNGSQSWQKNEGDYFPEWLRELAVALINPIPDLEQTVKDADDGELKKLMGNTYFSWMIMSSNGTTEKGMGGSVAITDKTGLLFYAGGTAWGGLYSGYQDFHGRMVARKVQSGTPEVTADIVSLADLGSPAPDLFSTDTAGGSIPFHTQVLDERSLRVNLQSADPSAWPPIKDGPLEGALTTRIAVDQNGKVREIGTIVSDNPGIADAAREQITALRFAPFLQNGQPVQVVSRFTLAFKTVRPAGVETFDTARNYFERGRLAGFPAAGKGASYILRATFQAKTADGKTQEGTYDDSWRSANEWLREASIGNSRFVRSQDGDTRYLKGEGPDEKLLRIVMRIMEPIPAMDTFVESDWRMKRETVDGMKTIRVLSGYENPHGELDPEKARAYWFNESGNLVRVFISGMDIRRSNFAEFDSALVARQIQVLYQGTAALAIKVTQIGVAGGLRETNFTIPKHKWKRAFTDEVR
jgi:hypothetical protein